MKVAFIGTHGVGKTTLAYGLAMRLKELGANVGFLEEVVHRCPLVINEDTDLGAQTWILMETIRREIELDNVYTEIVCDRSVIDNYCYLEFGLQRQPVLFDLACYWAATYDLLFKVPVHPENLQDDSARSTDIAFQTAIDETIDKLLDEAGIKHAHFTTLENAVEQARVASGRLPIA